MENSVKFAIVVDGTVEGIIAIPVVPFTERIRQAIQSDGVFVETSENVAVDYKWDGENFTPPQKG